MTHRTFLAILFASILLFHVPCLSFAQDIDSGKNQGATMVQATDSLNVGLEAAKAGDYSKAYSKLEYTLRTAQQTGHSKAAEQTLGFLRKISKDFGKTALKNNNWSEAVIHFEKGVEHAENDAYMHYGRGYALAEMGAELGDAEMRKEGAEALQRAVEVGNRTDNARVVKLAEGRIAKLKARRQKAQAEAEHIESVREKGYGIALIRQTFDKNSSDGISVGLGLVNISEEKTVKYAKITWKLFNSVGDPTAGDNSGDEVAETRLVGPLEPGAKGYTEFENVWYNSVGTCAQIQRIEIEYIDGTSFTYIDDLSDIAPETVRLEGGCSYEAQQGRKN